MHDLSHLHLSWPHSPLTPPCSHHSHTLLPSYPFALHCREPIPSRSDMGLEVSYNPLSWRMNSRLSDHISPFSHDTMPKEPPPYPLPPPLLETDNRFASASTSNLPTQFHSLFELRHAAMERDESEWYLKVGLTSTMEECMVVSLAA